MGITLEQYKNRTAEISVGASSLRGHPTGTIETVRKALRCIKLEEFNVDTLDEFKNVLSKYTNNIQKEIQTIDKDALYWGSARKSINIFLMNICQHYKLRNYYHFDRIEKYLEVPLDRQVADKLRDKFNSKLPRWKTIKDLQPKDSEIFQQFAIKYSEQEKCLRYELDLLFWRSNKNYIN